MINKGQIRRSRAQTQARTERKPKENRKKTERKPKENRNRNSQNPTQQLAEICMFLVEIPQGFSQILSSLFLLHFHIFFLFRLIFSFSCGWVNKSINWFFWLVTCFEVLEGFLKDSWRILEGVWGMLGDGWVGCEDSQGYAGCWLTKSYGNIRNKDSFRGGWSRRRRGRRRWVVNRVTSQVFLSFFDQFFPFIWR